MAEKIYITALSLGAGIQSVTLALLLERGMLPGYPAPDLAVYADTQADPPHVYQTLDWLEPKLSFPIFRATQGDLYQNTLAGIEGRPVPGRHRAGHSNGYGVDIPVFGLTNSGMLSRQCTGNYKTRVIKRTVREFASAAPPRLQVTQYIGISFDEAKRIKEAPEDYITNSWPLAMSRWTRLRCIQFLESEYPGHPVGKSSCFFCPYRPIEGWREVRSRYPDLYQKAIEMDRALQKLPVPWALRHGGLEQAMAVSDTQGRLFTESDQFNNECEGHCGV